MTDPADYACRWNAPSCKARVHEHTARLRAEIERLTEARDGALLQDRDFLLAKCERFSAALALIATPPRPDGTWNRDRQACYELAKQELERTQ